jgi:hypothetical protein
MKLILVLLMSLGLSVVYANDPKGETKDVKVGNKTQEVRVPKSARIDCKLKANKEKTECKKQPKEMPKIDKPIVKEEPKKEPDKK